MQTDIWQNPLPLYSFALLLLYSSAPCLLTTLFLTTYLLLYSLLPYSLLLTTLLLTTLLLTPYSSTTYYFLPYSSFLFQSITTFCQRQMGHKSRLYRIFVQYFVYERGEFILVLQHKDNILRSIYRHIKSEAGFI